MHKQLTVQVLALLLVGCHAHQQLMAPPATAPLQARQQAYAQLRPVRYERTQHYSVYQYGVFGPGMATPTIRTTDYLQLAGGQRVYHAEDLLPVVSPGSVTARAIAESESDSRTATLLMGLFVGTLAAGAGIALAPYLVADDASQVGWTPLLLGVGVMLGSMAFGIPGMLLRQSSHDATATAYDTYDASLRQQLGL